MTDAKLARLIELLKDMESAVLAFSGGADSSFLLKALHLSGIRVLAVTADSELTPRSDVLIAGNLAKDFGIEHRIIQTQELAMEDFVRNTPERCYVCKKERCRILSDIAASGHYRVILDGSNADDADDYRPGKRAAAEYHVRSPLEEAGFTKKESRDLSRQLGLSTWNKPSSPCLATRFPYGRRITGSALRRVAAAEAFLSTFGFREIRVRDYGDMARIEVDADKIERLLTADSRNLILETLRAMGYLFVSLDLEGYTSGSMNRVLRKE